MLGPIKDFLLKMAENPSTDNAVKGLALGGGTISATTVLTPDLILGIAGASIALFSLGFSIYFGNLRKKEERLRREEMKRANDLKERELNLREQGKI